MFLEPCRILADWLGHATYGVNAYLLLIPRDAGDPAVPPVQTIVDETRNEGAATHKLVEPFPCLVLTTYAVDAITGQVSQEIRDLKPAVLIRYGIEKTDADKAMMFASYTFRAVLRSLQDLHKAANEAARRRNGIALYDCADLRIVPAMEPLEGSIASGGIIATYNARDYTLTP